MEQKKISICILIYMVLLARRLLGIYGSILLSDMRCLAFRSSGRGTGWAKQTTRQAHRIVSYNVLSKNLADPDYFDKCLPEHLDPEYRMQLLRDKLQNEITKESIICMQELTVDWAGKLHVYFAQNKYHLVTGLYGKKFDGYMGVGIAYPAAKYDSTDVDISRITDTKLQLAPKASTKEKSSYIVRVLNKVLSVFALKLKQSRPDVSSVAMLWDEALRRHNQMVSICLKDKTCDDEFIVGTYHMPCAFRLPPVMTIHCALAAQHIQRQALDKGLPYALVGDFNIKPQDSMYRLLTEGSVEASSPDLPPPLEGDSWSVRVEPMRSAYVVAQGKEPDFTNYAQVRGEEPFIDTLDYIFLSKEWGVHGVTALSERGDVESGGSLPNATEPSDHIMIAADMSLQ